MVVAGSAGAMAQLAMLYDATFGAVVSLPFFILTNALGINWITGGARAVLEGRFSAVFFLKAPFRWVSYIIAAILLVQGGLLFSSVTGGMDPSAGVVTALYVVGFLKEGESAISNLGASEVVRNAWTQLVERFGQRP
jgi:hypothetical protein